MRDGVKGPAELAGANFVGSNVAGGGGKLLGHAAADDEQVLVDDAWGREGDGDAFGIAAEAFAEVDAAVGSEAGDGFAGAGVQRVDEVADGREDARGFGFRL